VIKWASISNGRRVVSRVMVVKVDDEEEIGWKGKRKLHTALNDETYRQFTKGAASPMICQC
jgi:hypothetical protein